MNCNPRFAPSLIAGFLLSAVSLVAQTTTFFWTGQFGSNFHDSRNWVDEQVPTSAETDVAHFGNVPSTTVSAGGITIAGIAIVGNTRPYSFETSVVLGSEGLIYAPVHLNPAFPFFSVFDSNVTLNAHQTWDIQSGRLEISGSVQNVENSVPFHLTKTGAGTLVLRDAGNDSTTWTGGLSIADGRVVVQTATDDWGNPIPSYALGSGLVTMDSTGGGAPTLVSSHYFYNGEGFSEDVPVMLSNMFSLRGQVSFENEAETRLFGSVALGSDVTIKPSGEPLFVHGPVADGGQGFKLTVDGPGLVVLAPASQAGTEGPINTYSGGTHVQSGGLIFADSSAIPSVGALTMSSDGYIGYASGANAGTFLASFDSSGAAGTIGFDTAPGSESLTAITDPIDLTGFNSSVRLGSVTTAILSNTITPAGANYQFGGGGGLLIIDTPLTDNGQDPRAVVLSSEPSFPLAVWITSTGNSFTGGVQATNGAVILGADWPATGNFTLGPGGYIGTGPVSELATDQDYAAHIARYTGGQGVIGFDYSLLEPTPRVLSNNLHLPAGFAFGTASRLVETIDGTMPGLMLTGNITGDVVEGSQVLRFAGYRGGAIAVASSLTDQDESTPTRVVIGDPFSTGTFGSPNDDEYSTVALTGDNSYSGTTTLYTGQLAIGQANADIGLVPTSALGSGALVVQPHNISIIGEETDDLYPLLISLEQDLIIANPIQLNSTLSLGGNSDFELAGQISGQGSLIIGEESDYGIWVSLTGDNSNFGGGVYVANSAAVFFGSDTSAGTGKLGFGGYSGGSAIFLSSNPSLGALESNDYAEVELQPGATLTLAQNSHTTFRGEIYEYEGGIPVSGGGFQPPPSDETTVRMTGTGSIRFTSNQYVDRFIIEAGTVVAGVDYQYNSIMLGDSVTLAGGTLLVTNNNYFESPLELQSGTLAGHGYISPWDNSIPVIGANVTLSPGSTPDGGIGTLNFYELNLASSGTYAWNLRDSGTGNAQDAAPDMVVVGATDTLFISATAEDPFIIRAVTLNSSGVNGIVSGFEVDTTYVWTLMNYQGIDGITEQFNPSNVVLQLDDFQTTLAGTATLEFTSLDGWGELRLHFTTIPEPSTYALLALGLGFIGVTVWRRRRA